MSPRLLFLLTAQRTHRPFEFERDRIDARLAAARMSTSVPRLLAVATPVPADYVLPEAA